MPDGLRAALLCITPAPAIDRTAHVAHITHGEVLRPLELVALPGGKGVNAARAAVQLGGQVVTTGIAGGHAGRWIVEALETEGLTPRWSFAAAESRTTYVTVDGSGESVIVYERPGRATDEEFEAFLQLLETELLPSSGRAVVAGSIPAGIDARGHAAIVRVCRGVGVPLLVDASGAGLVAALAEAPDIVKIGRIEAIEAGLVGAGADSAEVADALVAAGAQLAVVTDGALEVAAADRTHRWRADVPRVDAVNAVGSGDSFNAALSLALMAGADVAAALAQGIAAGSANALTLSAATLERTVAQALAAQVTVATARR